LLGVKLVKSKGFGAAPFLFTSKFFIMMDKRNFLVGNTITGDTIPVKAETWYEAMNYAYWRWNCKINRHDMYNAGKPKKRKEVLC
jgi:hypothetical protein